MSLEYSGKEAGKDASGSEKSAVPSINLPKGGGAIRGIGEKFAANPVTGTGSMIVPIATSPGRNGFGPQLSISYDSGSSNGLFGLGWHHSLPSIVRKTDKGLPQYWDADESDVFILSGAEDLVPILIEKNGKRERESFDSHADEPGYFVQRYRPRIEGLFSRIERWTDKNSGISHWRSVTKDNITTLYGKHDAAKIVDSADPTRIFQWLICGSYDDKGNAILYEYKAENNENIDHAAPQESNRLISGKYTQRYLKRIKYGNLSPNRDAQWKATDPSVLADWLFELVLDYGEHDLEKPTVLEDQPWPVRQDPFSSYRSTFEVRTYRLCRRVLMFHHFPNELGTPDCLVRSTDFDFNETLLASFITSVSQSGYTRQPDGSYLKRSMPKLEFKYSQAQVDETVLEVDQSSIENLPNGVDGTHYQWVDLDSEGLNGVLAEQVGGQAEQADTWYYKRNLGNGTFGAVEVVATRPAMASLNQGRQHLMDLNGDGLLELVQYDAPLSGYHKRTTDGAWENFTPFQSTPNVAWHNPNLRFVDLTGDGFADILITEDTVITWYPSRAERGFGPERRAPQSWDEEKGPKLVFSDPAQSIFLADMSGDGLTDLVRIRNGEVCYWPNLGYGRFGAKVTMSGSPVFDYSDNFDPKRIRLADIDGSGCIDIIYLTKDEICLYFNQSGNGWSAPQRLTHYPQVDNLSSVTTVDLLGNGTACLVWSSPLSGNARQPMRYIDLMGGQKPHLLVYTNNNMGAETTVQYVASTKFYLQDRLEGHPWVTRLPFPVHVIERTENRDLVSNTTLVTAYRYRHGYFDGVEREFRGFAYVEHRSDESVIGAFDLPPVVTKTWFHTGALLQGSTLEAYFKNPANKEYFTGDPQAVFLPDTLLPPEDLSTGEIREACRALKGSILRQEVYADDGSAKAQLPYSVSERSYQMRLVQPRGPNHNASFFSHASEAIDYHYEREMTDPRISHALTLEVDEFGNVTKSAAVGYGRRRPDPDLNPDERTRQTQTLITYTETSVINKPNEVNWYRIGVPVEVRTFEITGLTPATALFTPAKLSTGIKSAGEISYEQIADGSPQKRDIEHARTLYRRNNLNGFLPLGQLESMALPGESYKLAFTPGLLDVYQSKDNRSNLTALLTGAEGRYRNLDNDGRLWIPSGQIFYSHNIPADPANLELAFARENFFLPHRFQDIFGNQSVVTYDDQYKLLIVYTRDAVGNEAKADNDYRVLSPRRITDLNGNRTEVRFDALGMVVGTAVMGKTVGPVEGDSFASFTADLSTQAIKDFFDAQNPRALATQHLGTATTRVVYDLERIPVCAAAITRETHVSDLGPGENTKVHLSFIYSDGFGREAQTKIPAEPGPLDPNDPGSPKLDPRWVGTGAKVYNNKGKPVRQYEPFFSATPHFGIEQHGVSSTLFYDPVERVVATLHPNNTFEKVVFDPWRQITYDVNDTVTLDPKIDPDVCQYLSRLPDADYLPTWYQQRINGALGAEEKTAATKASAHANTPATAYFDTLGRTFLSIADNGKDGTGQTLKCRTTVELDIEGNQRSVKDALNRIVMKYDYDILGGKIHQSSMEAGERWMLNNAAGKSLRVWNNRGHMLRRTYDPLLRPTGLFVQGVGPTEILAEHTVYGEAQGYTKNHRGKIYQHHDSAGVATNVAFDFKGNLLRSTRQLVKDYKNVPDWSANLLPEPEKEVFTAATLFDALNRPVQVIAPHSDQAGANINVIRPGYNEAKLLERVDVWLAQGAEPTVLLNPPTANLRAVTNVDYDAKGQRTLIEYGNGAATEYAYDKNTLRLINLKTTGTIPGSTSFLDRLLGKVTPPGPIKHQDLNYTYDPVGNITHIRDDAQQTVYFKNQVVEASNDYSYDPLYRLIEASGREHIGQLAAPQTSWNDEFRVNLAQPGEGSAMRNYTEHYQYDAVGNFEQLIHQAANGNWTRVYSYAEANLIEAGKTSNRLSSTTVGSTVTPYVYDAHGSMTAMPHLTRMDWDFKDQLSVTSRQAINETPPPDKVPETTYYVYDAGGQRIRKVTERQNGSRKAERIYLGGFEIYREFKGNGADLKLERETLHIMDDKQRIVLVETRTQGSDGSPRQLIRYQFGNHLGSASLELDDKGSVISYEEYFPYGSTSYHSVDNGIKAAAKRYRYTGKERDEETGFAYHGARYYAPWLGRWTSCDPTGIRSGVNQFVYVSCNPIRLVDPSGKAGEPPSFWQRHGTRIIGGLQVVGGALEIAAGVAGLAAPTGVTQVLGTVAVVHGADTLSTGLTTLWTGKVQETLTQQAATGGAQLVGASPETAHTFGAVVDFTAGVVPSAGLGLAKAAATRGTVELGTQTATHAAPEVAAHAAPEVAAHAAPEVAAHAAPQVATRAASKSAESLLRVRIVDALERSVQRQGQKLASAIAQRDIAFLQRLGLSPKQINILINRQTSQPFAAIYGQAMERLLDRAIRSSSLLSKYFKHIGSKAGVAVAGSGRPDWMGKGLMQGVLVDLTTVAGRANHYARYYGEKMLVLTYARP